MSVLVLLIFASLAVAAVFLAAFIWAVRSGQYEDTCTPSMRVLMEDLTGNLNLDTGPQSSTVSAESSANPKGIAASSPALRGTSYAGSGKGADHNPNGVAALTTLSRHNPVGVGTSSPTTSQGSSCLATLAGLRAGIPLGFGAPRL